MGNTLSWKPPSPRTVSYTHLDPEGGEEQPDILGSLYDETQQWIMENYPDSYAAQTYIDVYKRQVLPY